MNLDQLKKLIADESAPFGELAYCAAYWEWSESFALPTEADLEYADQTPEKRVDYSEPPILSNATLWVGHQVQLSTGQRAVLRERFEMTPTPTLIVREVQHFESPYSNLIRAVTVESVIHSAQKGRRAIMKMARIRNFGEFLRAAKELDTEVHKVSDRPEPTAKARSTKKQQSIAELEAEYL